jgi:hypothetical protein
VERLQPRDEHDQHGAPTGVVTWPTPVGTFVSTVQLDERSRPVDLVGPVSGRLDVSFLTAPLLGRAIKRGVPITVDGLQGTVVRPRYGVRARSRTLQVSFDGGPTFEIRARMNRIELSRDGVVVASNRDDNLRGTRVAPAATAGDTAVAILLSVANLWESAALWGALARTEQD